MHFFYFIFLSLIVFFLTSSSSAEQLILMSPGERKQILSPSSEDISLSHGGIVKIHEAENTISLLARKQGTVFLNHGSKTKIIKVLEEHTKSAWLEFINQISKNPWLKWNFSKDTIHILGSLHFFQTWKKLAQIAEKHNIPYEMRAEISPKIQKQAEDFFKQKGESLPFKIYWKAPVTAVSPENFHSPLFSSYGILTKKDDKKIFSPSLVEIHLLLTEISSNHAQLFQIKNAISLLPLSIKDIMGRMDHIQNKGEGHVIASTKILVESGKEGSFLIGGEAPVHDYNLEKKSKHIRWKPYGISLKLKPIVYSKKRIQIHFSVEISEIDPSHSSEGSPATKNHRLSSQIHIPNKKTLCLSQLQRSQWGKSNRIHPGFFSKFSLINSFLFNKGSSRETTKAFIFITPQILDEGFKTKGDKNAKGV